MIPRPPRSPLSSSSAASDVYKKQIARKLMGEEIAEAEILLYGSFLATGKGHGTNMALVAGLMGMKPCLLYTSPSPRDGLLSRMPPSA